MSLGLTSDELRSEWVLLLEMQWASRVFRWTSGRAVVLSSEDGELAYRPGLAPSWEDAADLLSVDAEGRSIAISDLWLPEDVDAAALVAAGHGLDTARAEISLWAPGRPYERRIVLLSGRCYAPTYGGADEPIAFSLEDRAYEDAAYLIPAEARVSRDTWPFADPANYGKAYPLVVGKPGRYLEADGSEGKTCGSPALLVHVAAKKFLVAGHAVAATTVRIINVTKGEARDETIEQASDGLGRTVTVIDGSGTGLSVVEGDEYWCRWDDGLAAVDEETGAGLQLAGSVLRSLLRRSTVQTDRARWKAVQGYLNRYRLDFYADDPDVTIWDWIADNLLPILPLSVVSGPRGLRPILIRPDLRVLDAVDAIEAGPTALRSSPVQYSTEDAVQLVTVSYALRGDSGDYLRSVTLSGDRLDEHTSAPLRRSRLRFLRDDEEPRELRLETDVIYDRATAELVAATLAGLHAIPHREVSYSLDPSRFGTLEPGDVVTVTDEEVSFSDEIAVVQSVSWSTTTIDVRLVLVSGL